MKKLPPIETRFQPGHPKVGGSRKGTRHKLSEAFLKDLAEEWREHGPAVLRIVRAEEPATLVKIVAATLPKEFEINNTSSEAELSDERLDAILSYIDQRLSGLGASGAAPAPDDGEDEAHSLN